MESMVHANIVPSAFISKFLQLASFMCFILILSKARWLSVFNSLGAHLYFIIPSYYSPESKHWKREFSCIIILKFWLPELQSINYSKSIFHVALSSYLPSSLYMWNLFPMQSHTMMCLSSVMITVFSKFFSRKSIKDQCLVILSPYSFHDSYSLH